VDEIALGSKRLSPEVDAEGVVRLPGIERGTHVVIAILDLEFLMTESYAAGMAERPPERRG
jgi:hypothetical protein